MISIEEKHNMGSLYLDGTQQNFEHDPLLFDLETRTLIGFRYEREQSQNSRKWIRLNKIYNWRSDRELRNIRRLINLMRILDISIETQRKIMYLFKSSNGPNNQYNFQYRTIFALQKGLNLNLIQIKEISKKFYIRVNWTYYRQFYCFAPKSYKIFEEELNKYELTQKEKEFCRKFYKIKPLFASSFDRRIAVLYYIFTCDQLKIVSEKFGVSKSTLANLKSKVKSYLNSRREN